MLHEVLFALAGHSGGIFYDSGDGIRVMIHPSALNYATFIVIKGLPPPPPPPDMTHTIFEEFDI